MSLTLNMLGCEEVGSSMRLAFSHNKGEHSHLIYLPLHASQVWPVVDEWKNNANAILPRLCQNEIQAL